MKRRVRRPTSHSLCFQGAKTTFRPHERQKASCESQKYTIFHHNNEALEETIKRSIQEGLALTEPTTELLETAFGGAGAGGLTTREVSQNRARGAGAGHLVSPSPGPLLFF